MTPQEYNKFYLAWFKAMQPERIRVTFFFTKLSARGLDLAYDQENRNN